MSSEILAAFCILLYAYPFVIYPALLSILAPSGDEGPGSGETPSWPNVAMVICALNEEKSIRQKIENSLALEYPKDKLRIVVVSDGSTDRTVPIAREYLPAISLVERPQRCGKVANLNMLVPTLEEDVVVFSDANVIYESNAVLHLVGRLLSDPTIGCVSGKVILVSTTDELKKPEEMYYSVEWMLHERASRFYSMVGADGAMYAIWRKLFRQCPNDTIVEDVVIPTAIVRQGFRAVLEPRAVAWESGVTSIAEEFKRKTRIAAGAAQGLLRGNLWPTGAPARYWFIFFSHKLLRWLSPWIGLAALAALLVAKHSILNQVVLAGLALMVIAALLKGIVGRSFFLLDAPFYFLFGQVTLLLGMLKGAAGKQSVLWQKSDR